MKRIAHVDRDGDALVVQCAHVGDAAIAFVLLGQLLLKTPGAFKPEDRKLLEDLIGRLVSVEFPPTFIIERTGS